MALIKKIDEFLSIFCFGDGYSTSIRSLSFEEKQKKLSPECLEKTNSGNLKLVLVQDKMTYCKPTRKLKPFPSPRPTKAIITGTRNFHINSK
jgi:hypothetical protein